MREELAPRAHQLLQQRHTLRRWSAALGFGLDWVGATDSRVQRPDRRAPGGSRLTNRRSGVRRSSGCIGFDNFFFLVTSLPGIELVKANAAGAAAERVHRKQQIQDHVPSGLGIRVPHIRGPAFGTADRSLGLSFIRYCPVYTR